MRIVGGKFRGRALKSPADDRITRPTSDRVREAVFNILAHGSAAVDFDGAKVLDLFAGTGALGLEALSRGAQFCLFVEEDADARGTIRDNIEALGLTGITKIFRRDATDLGPAARHGQFDIVFLDPPYGKGLGEKALTVLDREGWLLPGARIVFEERKGARPDVPPAFTILDQRSWGDTEVWFLGWQTSSDGKST
jgi:16S rRNA (guanine966-N2)-methyltransferase